MEATHKSKWLLSALGIATLFYCLLVLGFVGTGPDVGLRFRLVDTPHAGAPKTKGPVIQFVTPSLKHKGEQYKRPAPGDILVGMGPRKDPDVRDLQPIG